MTSKIKMKWIIQDGEEWYESNCGLTLKREHGELAPGGLYVKGQWVLRDNMDIVMDWGSFRDEIEDKNNLDLLGII